MSLLIQIASNYKCSHRDCSFFPLLACSQLTLTAMGRATDASNRSPSLSNQVAGEGSLPPMTNSNSSSKLAHRLFKGWGLIDLPLRVSTEGLLRPRVARAQKIISLHPHSVPGAQDQREHFPPPSKLACSILSRTVVLLLRASEPCWGLALARITHEHFCCNRRSAATTSLRSAGSPLGPSTYCTSTPQVLRTPRAGLATRLSDFVTNCHEYCGLAKRRGPFLRVAQPVRRSVRR